MECFVIIVNGWKLPAVNYYHKTLHLGCCSSPRSASDYGNGFIVSPQLKNATFTIIGMCQVDVFYKSIYPTKKSAHTASKKYLQSSRAV